MPADIDKIARVYTRTLSIKMTARELGHAFETVQRYVEDGDPARGIPSIKSTLAKRAQLKGIDPPAKRIAYSVHDAFESSTNVLRLVKGLFSAKFGAMLKELDDAYKTNDPVKVAAAQARCFPHIKVSDVPRVAIAEALLFEKMGPKEEGGGANTPLPQDVADEVSDILEELGAHGLIVEDDERSVERSEDAAQDDEEGTDDDAK
jgi:hypothetical protein